MSDDLSSIRSTIDEIDQALVSLLSRRFLAAREAARIKQRENLPIYDKAREDAVIARAAAQADPECRDALCALYRAIIEACREFEGMQHV